MFNFFKKIITVKTLCPNCSIELEKTPSKKTKCSNCNNYIYVRTRPTDEHRVLVTEAEAKKIDEQWKTEPSHSRWLREIESLGTTKQDFQKTQVMLRKKFGKEPPFRDIIWSLFNQLIMRGESPYFSMALFLDDEGRNPAKMLEANNLESLKRFKNSSVIKSIKIATVGNQACDSCKKQENKIFKINAINDVIEHPVLPCKNCSFLMTERSKYGFCRCSYIPEEISLD